MSLDAHPTQPRSSRSEPSCRSAGNRFCALAASLVLATTLFSCDSSDRSDPRLRERILSIEAEALDPLLARGAELDGTPLARQAQALRARLSGCIEVWGHFSASSSTSDTPEIEREANASQRLRCRDTDMQDAELMTLVGTLRGEHAGLLLWPLGEDGRLELRLDVDDQGGLLVEGIAIPPTVPGPLGLFIPGPDAPAPPVIASSKTLLHTRMRPANGIRLASLIPAGSQGDRLFALKGRLLEGALLSGTWEFAFMPPAEGGQVPLALGALHHRLAGPVREAVSEALDRLESTWPIQRTARSFREAGGDSFEGGCYFDLPLLPELAPCWVVTDEALLIGYRDVAIEAALTVPDVSSAPASRTSSKPLSPGRGGQLDLYLDRFEHVDQRLLGGGDITRPGDLYSRFELRLEPNAAGQISILGRLGTQR